MNAASKNLIGYAWLYANAIFYKRPIMNHDHIQKSNNKNR